MNEPTRVDPDRRSGDADAREALSPEIVKLLLLCGAEVREADRSAIVTAAPAGADDRRAVDRRDRDRRHVERRFSERRHDERRATAS